MKPSWKEVDLSAQLETAARLVDVYLLSPIIDALVTTGLDASKRTNDVLASLVETDEAVRHITHLELIGRYVLPFVNNLPVEEYEAWIARTAEMVPVHEVDLLCLLWDWTQVYG